MPPIPARFVARSTTLALACMLAGCGTPPETAAPAPLRVAAAADLQSSLPGIVAEFERAHSLKVDLVFGASGQLAQQIEAGAPFDLFLSANRKFVDDLETSGLVRPKSSRPYAVGSLILVWGEHAGKPIAALGDLARPEIKRVAIANHATAPYGAAAEQALRKAGLLDSIGPKLVRATNVRQALQYVESGDAEAALVGKALARPPGLRVLEVDPELYDPIVQGLGVVAASRRVEDAEALAAYLLGPEGQAKFQAAGFRPAPPQSP
ncbi:molybdate ABC transporter substrate-binding protein [Isosphaeraceae bacterium EP7]